MRDNFFGGTLEEVGVLQRLLCCRHILDGLSVPLIQAGALRVQIDDTRQRYIKHQLTDDCLGGSRRFLHRRCHSDVFHLGKRREIVAEMRRQLRAHIGIGRLDEDFYRCTERHVQLAADAPHALNYRHHYRHCRFCFRMRTCRFWPRRDADRFFLICSACPITLGELLPELLTQKRHERVQEAHRLFQHVGGYPECFGFAVREPLLDTFKIPVAELVPEERIDCLCCFVEPEVLKRVGCRSNRVVQAAAYPLDF